MLLVDLREVSASSAGSWLKESHASGPIAARRLQLKNR